MKKEKSKKVSMPVIRMEDALRRELVGRERAGSMIAFRGDTKTINIMKILGEISNKSKTDIIISALQQYYHKELLEHIYNRIYPIIQKVFDKADKCYCTPEGSMAKLTEAHESPDSKIQIPFDAASMHVHIPQFTSRTVNKKLRSHLNMLDVDATVEELKTLKLEFTKPILSGPVSEFDKSFMPFIHETAAKYDLLLRQENLSRSSVGIEFYLDYYISLQEKDWEKSLEKKLRAFKNAVNEIRSHKIFEKKIANG